MRRRYQPSKLQRIDDILQKILKKHRIPLKTADRRLQNIWLQAVGPRIAAQTCPEIIKKTVLFVKVANASWMQQLHLMKHDILDNFNRLHPQDPVSNIFFTIGEINAHAAKTNDPFLSADKMPVLKDRDKKMIEKSLAAIADEELHDILKRAMTKEVTRRRMMEKQRDR
jgi:hypothetical protein